MLPPSSNPHIDVLGHCTGRMVAGRGAGRSRSSTPSRSSPPAADTASPSRSTPGPTGSTRPSACCGLAAEPAAGSRIDSDAHAPGQLDWQPYGCERAARCGVPAGRVINTMTLPGLLAWTAAD